VTDADLSEETRAAIEEFVDEQTAAADVPGASVAVFDRIG